MRLCRCLSLKNSIGIYIHIPFCLKKCDYCDFYSVTDHSVQDEYVKSLINELESYKNSLKARVVSSIYFGGGTPSLLTIKNINAILNKIYKYEVNENIEITLEANPETLSYEYLKELKTTRINRLSIGMQSLDDEMLKQIGRVHSRDKFLEEYENARSVGFENISIDVMFGFYGQTMESFGKTLDEVVGLKPNHISCYSLIFEEGTKMYDKLECGTIEMLEEDLQVEMYKYMVKFFRKNGYNRYEISNFAIDGYKSKHNSSYWQNVEYIGLGASASSYIDNTRYSNERNIKKYIENFGLGCRIDKEELAKEDLISEYFFLGLRQDEGVSIKRFEEQFNQNFEQLFGEVVRKLSEEKLIELNGDILKLSEYGVQLSNYVFEQFLV